MDTILKILSDIRPEFDFSGDVNFIDSGYLDSFDVIALVGELEASFQILIDGMSIVPENFESLEAIAALVRRSGGTVA